MRECVSVYTMGVEKVLLVIVTYKVTNVVFIIPQDIDSMLLYISR